MATSLSSLHRFSKSFLDHAPAICLAFGCLFLAGFARAELKLGTTFTDNMVLQRDRDVTIWGESEPGSSISIHFGTSSASAVADARGHWNTSFKPLPVGGPYSATVSNGTETIELKNILSGDVWLCSGQSNMQFGLGEDIAAVSMRKKALSLPNLRLLSIPKLGADKPNYRIDAFRLMRYHEGFGAFVIFCETICIAFVVYFTVKEIRKWRADKIGYFKSYWLVAIMPKMMHNSN